MARRSSVWTEIQRDRALRRRQSEKAERVHLKVERELQADAARSRTAEDRQAKALEKERVEAEHQAALMTASEQSTRLSARINELADMLRSSVGQRPLSIADLRQVDLAPFDPGEDGLRLRTPRRPILEEGGLLSRSRRRREFDEAMERYADELAGYERREGERSARLAAMAEEYERRVRAARAAAAAEAKRIQNGIIGGDAAAIEEFARLAINASHSRMV